MPTFSAIQLGRLFLLACAGLPLRCTPRCRPASLPDTMEQRVAACLACHAKKEATTQFFPRIAGKPAGYLYNQLINFREGRRQYPLMTYMVDHMPDAYLREIADYFAASIRPTRRPAGRRQRPPCWNAAGCWCTRRRRRQGAGLRGLPRRALTGVAPAIPGLARPAARLHQRPVRRLEATRCAAPSRPTAWPTSPPPERSRREPRVQLARPAAAAAPIRARRAIARRLPMPAAACPTEPQ
jgi:cytochrome c553